MTDRGLIGQATRTLFALSLACSLCIELARAEAPPKLPRCAPEAVGMSSQHLQRIDGIVAAALDAGRAPGCVVAIGRSGKIVFLKAYGFRSLRPEKVPMTTDTLFDMASITKPVATATSVMILVDRGLVRVGDRVAKYVPEFGANGKERITIAQLLTHQGGLIPDNALSDYDDGPEKALERIYALEPVAKPGTVFKYTDVGYIVLSELVRRVSGQDEHRFTQENLFGPLGMTETGFLPREELRRRAAVTEERDGKPMRGEVHDPRAYRLGGIAGHAGLFSTADDLAVYAQMMLGRGAYGGVRILGPATVALMTRPQKVSSGVRTLGFDMRTGYSSNRGENFSDAAYGHGGFTGTVLWIDPKLDLFVIFLSNRVHMEPDGSVNRLAGRIGTIAAASIGRAGREHPVTSSRPDQSLDVLTGIDVLARDGFKPLDGARLGLITNHTGLDRGGRRTVDVLHEAPNVTLVAIFSPEHGIFGKSEASAIADARDEKTGLPIYSLYGESRSPTAESLAGIDTLAFDIQDIGARFYTYPATMGNAMRAAAKHGLRFVVLDRPNPIGGKVAGPVLDAGRESFVGYHRIAVRHGMTVGELARMFNDELGIGCKLEVAPVEGWRRAQYYDETGLLWVNPSPNMRSLTEAVLYPSVGLLETTNVSVGRGTDTPFEVLGAPWIDSMKLARALNEVGLPGVRFVPIRFTPSASKFAGAECGGVNLHVTDRAALESVRTGLEIAVQLRRLFPDDWDMRRFPRLLSSAKVLKAVSEGRPSAEIQRLYADELAEFIHRRQKYLLYE